MFLRILLMISIAVLSFLFASSIVAVKCRQFLWRHHSVSSNTVVVTSFPALNSRVWPCCCLFTLFTLRWSVFPRFSIFDGSANFYNWRCQRHPEYDRAQRGLPWGPQDGPGHQLQQPHRAVFPTGSGRVFSLHRGISHRSDFGCWILRHPLRVSGPRLGLHQDVSLRLLCLTSGSSGSFQYFAHKVSKSFGI